MATFTSSLPDELLSELSDIAQELKMPKNKIIEKALTLYFDEIQKAKYVKSYRRASKDKDIMAMAEEGMADYYQIILDSENSEDKE